MTPLQKKLKSYARKINRAQSVIDRDMRRVLNANKLFLAELNRSQLVEGKSEQGEPIGNKNPYRSPKYAEYKNQINPLPGFGNPDLRLSGDYWQGITAKVEQRSFTMISTDVKAPDLSHYNGLGIAPENYPEIAELMRRLVNFRV